MPGRTELGAVQIRNEVIASIAAQAAQEVEGVCGVWRGWWPALPFLPAGMGVKVETQDQEVRLWMRLVTEYGVSLPEVALRVQDRVREMVERMTNLLVSEVHVSIQHVRAKGGV